MSNLPKFIQKNALIFILCLALFLRLIGLENHPEGLQGDEASFLANSQILIQTGHDEDNQSYPLLLKSLIDPKPALYSYLQIPFIKIFPQQQIAASRIPGALFGVGSILCCYLIILKLTRQKKLALTFATLLAISPWHINVSRATQETIMSFFFATLSFNFFLNLLNWKKPSRNKKNHLEQILNYSNFFISAWLAMYSYHSAKIFLPLLIGGWLFYLFFHTQKKNLRTRYIFILILLGIAFFSVMRVSDTLTRFKAIGFLNNPQVPIDVTTQSIAATGTIPFPLIRLLYNKVTVQALNFTQNYFAYFNSNFLFFFKQEPLKYALPFQGLFLFCDLPLMLLGIFLAIKQKRFWPFWWLAISPLAGALTFQEIPSMIRTFTMIVPLIFFISLAFEYLFVLKKSRPLIVSAVGVIYLLNWFYFWNQYWNMQPNYQPWYRNVAEMKLAAKLKDLHNTYEYINIYNDLTDVYLYLLLNNNVSPFDLEPVAAERLNSVFSIGRYHLERENCFPESINDSTLYVANMRCFEEIQDSTFSAKLTHLKDEDVTFKDKAGVYYLMVKNTGNNLEK